MQMLDFDYFKGRKVFVTGHTGFKGSWLCSVLLGLGAEVTGFALEPEGDTNLFHELDLPNRMASVNGDICDLNLLRETVETCEPEFVFHLAAQALVRESYSNPLETFRVNTLGSATVLEVVKAQPSVKSLVYVTSDKAYENKEWVWGYRESDEIGGRDPYSASKGAAELIFSSYLRSFLSERPDFGAASARAGNVIGGGDWAKDRIVPDLVRSILSDQPLILRNPNSTRPWQHVLEPISGYLRLALALRSNGKMYSESWNFGPDSSNIRTVVELTSSIQGHFGRGTVEIDFETSWHEANLLQLNCDKALNSLSWRPTWSADETFQKTAEWYKLVSEGHSARSVTDRQIRAFFGQDHD